MAERYRFDVGEFRCIAISDGTFAYPRPAQDVFINFFVNAPADDLRRVLRRHNIDLEGWNEYVSPFNCLLIDTGRHRVLVDTGAGGLAPTTGRLIPNMRAEGIAPEDVDAVIISHAHPDHIGGNLNKGGEPAFPNARYFVWRGEWDYWAANPSLAELKIDGHGKEILIKHARDNFLPIRDRLVLVDHETDVEPGIRVVSAPGHTPGHTAVSVSSRGEKLIHVSDTVLHPIHLEEPGWHSAVDFSPEQVLTTRRRLLNKATTENALVLATHFPFPGLGRVERKEGGWRWNPMRT